MKKIKLGELSWLLGILLCALGVHFAVRSGFGVSMVVAPAYVLHRAISPVWEWFSFGTAEYCLQGLLVILLAIVLRKFKWKYPLAFFTAMLYGFSLDFWNLLFGEGVFTAMPARIFSLAASMLITGLAIALFLRSYLPQQVYELIVKELTDHFGWNMTKVKWIYDGCSLLFSILLMLLLFRRFDTGMVGIGTLVVTLLNAPIMAMWGKLLDRLFSFEPALPKLYDSFEKYFD